MISNPCRWFISGSEEREFTFDGGDTFYHICPADDLNGEFCWEAREREPSKDGGGHMGYAYNVIIPANSPEHALQIFKEAIEFKLSCIGEREQRGDPFYIVDREEKRILKAIEENLITVRHVPTNQMYSVGWASNDTL